SYLSLTSDNSAPPLKSFAFEHEPGDVTTVEVPYHSFTLIDGDQTRYEFQSVSWNMYSHRADEAHRDAYAIPYFRLSNITDRWGRSISVTWSAYGVTNVTDGAGRGLTFGYTNNLISSITDAAGRIHTLTRTAYNGQPRLTGVTIQGAGSPNRASYAW